MSTLPGTPFITINGGSQQTVPLISSNGDLLNNAYVAVFTNTNGNYNFAGNSYTGYFKFQGMDTAENAVYIICVGGGGAGGNADGPVQTNKNKLGPGQGGGGGGTSLFWFNQLDPAYTYAVNVGFGGLGGLGCNGWPGGDSTVDCYDIDSTGNYILKYNLMCAGGGSGGDGNAFDGGNQSGPAGGGTTGIPNWGSYPYNSDQSYNDIGIGNFAGGPGGGGINSSVGNSTFPPLDQISNPLATTYDNTLPWFSTVMSEVSELQSSYGGGGQQGGNYYNQIDNSLAGGKGIGGVYFDGSNYGCGCTGESYGDAGGGAYWHETTVYDVFCWTNYYYPAPGGNGFQGCVIVVMIPGYSSIGCNPNSCVNDIPKFHKPRPPPPPPPPGCQPISVKDAFDSVKQNFNGSTIEIKSQIETQLESMSFEEILGTLTTYVKNDTNITNHINISNIENDISTIEGKIKSFLVVYGFESLDELKEALASSKRYYILLQFQQNHQYLPIFYEYIIPALIKDAACCYFFPKIVSPPHNIDPSNNTLSPYSVFVYNCLVVTGTKNTVNLYCKKDLSLNVICIGGGGGGGLYNFSPGGGGAGGNTCINRLHSHEGTICEINVGDGGSSSTSGGSTTVKVYNSSNSIILNAGGGGGGETWGSYNTGNEFANGGTASSFSEETSHDIGVGYIYNITGGNGGNAFESYSGSWHMGINSGGSVPYNITDFVRSYYDILNYFDISSNNLSITMSGDIVCPNIIQNRYGGGGGGGYYDEGSSGYNGSGGCGGGSVNTPIPSVPTSSIGSGGGGGGVTGQGFCGGQGLVIIYWIDDEATNIKLKSIENSHETQISKAETQISKVKTLKDNLAKKLQIVEKFCENNEYYQFDFLLNHHSNKSTIRNFVTIGMIKQEVTNYIKRYLLNPENLSEFYYAKINTIEIYVDSLIGKLNTLEKIIGNLDIGNLDIGNLNLGNFNFNDNNISALINTIFYYLVEIHDVIYYKNHKEEHKNMKVIYEINQND